ncbi:hypothetical protein EDD52_101445 [Primorskyibacter sedentarius]|uniref:Uncharacterized protein n=1 Tax=Primorskyibacter sedentarius TaxID=745311 RepID=A0A4R3JQB3_9RHOB|nr:hypothetical protein [Primorskyibacter sedentarius]TCS67349.1 hypothetical protein EDD52_101445 [Primorskyibacter sedentarius]
MNRIIHFKEASLKAAVVLIPSYTAAMLTDKMVWVVPTLAASSFFAATIGMTAQSVRQRVDEDASDHEDTSETVTEASVTEAVSETDTGD